MRLTALEEIRQQQQKEAALQQELIVLRMHMEDLERHFSQSDASHRMEKDRLYEQQQRTIDQLKTSYENELKNLQQGADIVESYNKKASLSILTLEKQLSQLAEEREHLLDELKEKEEDIRLLKRNLTQKDIENRRMSVVRLAMVVIIISGYRYNLSCSSSTNQLRRVAGRTMKTSVSSVELRWKRKFAQTLSCNLSKQSKKKKRNIGGQLRNLAKPMKMKSTSG
jgi:hypothetical protein